MAPLRGTVRPVTATVTEYKDEMIRCVMASTSAGVEVWGVWNVQQPDGSYLERSARCSPEAEAQIFALTGLPSALDLVRDDTHPRVTA